MAWSLHVGFSMRPCTLRTAKETLTSSSSAISSKRRAWAAMFHMPGGSFRPAGCSSETFDVRYPLRVESKKRAVSVPLACQKQQASSKPSGQRLRRQVEKEMSKGLAQQLGFDGIFPVNKPQNFTSYDVVAKIRSIISRHIRDLNPELSKKGSEIKVGHGGTLDPMATGVLVIGVGSGTRKMDFFTKGRKAYEAVGRFGFFTDTGDAEGKKVGEEHSWQDVTEERLSQVLNSYIGDILQRPPMYSAIKIHGVRAYELARKGIEVEIKPRPVRIHDIKLLRPFAETAPDFHLHVDCGGGTYIRSLISDIALDLGTAAHMTSLVRTQQGRFLLEDCVSVDELEPEKISSCISESMGKL